MALLHSTQSEMGSLAHDFKLAGIDGKNYSLESFKDKRALLIVFMCNHCPYVVAVHERLNRLAKDFTDKTTDQSFAMVGINSNDPQYNQDDSFENMKITAKEWGLVFPYVFDDTQTVARAYDAVCTPDPYLYENRDGKFRLRYRGRIDDSWKDAAQVKEESLRLAINSVLRGATPTESQIPSMGCSIKWKELTGQKKS